MAEHKNLGVIKIKHPSGMRETDKGFKVFSGEIGDTVMMGEKAYVVPKSEEQKTDKKFKKDSASVQSALTDEVGDDKVGDQ